jgi:hypothetical protein
LSVNVFPLDVTDVPVTFSEHWLFSKVPVAPGVAAADVVPASFSRLTWLVVGPYVTTQEADVFPAIMVLNDTDTDCRFFAPAVSVYCSANVWLKPEPELGVEATVTLTTLIDVDADEPVKEELPA